MTDPSNAGIGHSDGLEAIRRRVDDTFVTEANTYGCAETAFILLKEIYGLPDPLDSSAAMALNGGVAYEGSICGAITGAALAVGQLAGREVADHATAKRVARRAVQDALDAFVDEFGSTDCRTLTGFDLRSPGGHDAFIAAGRWRTACTEQLAFMIHRVAGLTSPARRQRVVDAVSSSPSSVEDGAQSAESREEDG
jgi:C_GCAxxG_C_C family probable redox protein